MRVLMVAPGTRGDVAPMAGLGSQLTRAGFDVSIAANSTYETLVTDAGCGFRLLPGDMGNLVTPAPAGQKASVSVLRQYMRDLGDYMQQAAEGTLAAAQNGVDVILANSISPYAFDVAEAFNVPAIGAYLQPMEPSTDYAPMALGMTRNFGPFVNKLLGTAFARAKAPYDAPSAVLRRELGLPKKSRSAAERQRRKVRETILHGFSSAVVPRPHDWHPGLITAGYWWPMIQPEWTPSAELTDFIADGPAPVFIGFGSSDALDVDFMIDTARKAGVRAILQGVEGVNEANALSIGAVPHSWLFPQMAAVVHHAGAGTAAAGLRAGVPTVSVPIFTDQPFWARRITELGAGPAAIPYNSLSVEKLSESIGQAISNPEYRTKAQTVSLKLADEDSTQPVIEALRAHAK